MSEFDRNQSSLIEKVVEENTNNPEIGIVDQVYEHSAVDDDSNWEVDVLIRAKTDIMERVPYHTAGNDIIHPPKRGDKVTLIYTKGGSFAPIAIGNSYSKTDRPALGKAGMYRNRFESGTSPTGDGDLHITGYTKYNESVASNKKDQVDPEETFVQITKHKEGDNMDPSDPNDSNYIPMKIEMYDSPTSVNDESHIHLNSEKIDQDENLGMDIYMDMKAGKLHVRANNDTDNDEYEFVLDVKNETAKIIGDSDSGNKMGASFDFDTDEFTIADGNKFGIESDGSGNFTWSHKSINFKEESGSTGSVDL